MKIMQYQNTNNNQNFGMIYVAPKVKNVFWSKLFLDKYGGSKRIDAITDVLYLKNCADKHIFVNANKSVEYVSPATQGVRVRMRRGKTMIDKFVNALNILTKTAD